jgi:hypothetical protein
VNYASSVYSVFFVDLAQLIIVLAIAKPLSPTLHHLPTKIAPEWAIAETPKKRGAHSNAIGKSPDDYPPHKRLHSNSSKNEIVIDSPMAAAACTLLYKSHYGGGGGDNEDNDSESEASYNRKKRRGKAKTAGKCAGSAVELEEEADVIEDILVLSRSSTKSGEKDDDYSSTNSGEKDDDYIPDGLVFSDDDDFLIDVDSESEDEKNATGLYLWA